MLPIGNLFDRFPRLVHDLGRKLSKTVELKVTGEQTEVDKTVLERLSDPLVHLIRNSMDHGIERPDVRRECGKPDAGTLHLHAEHHGGAIVIEISDDGAGLNEGRILDRARERGLVAKDVSLSSAEIQALIFAPGFSTADQLTDLSGRGVGMDVVRSNVEDLGGRIDLTSRAGFGTTIAIQLPLTLAIMEGQLLRVGQHRFVVPLTSIVESLRIQPGSVHSIGDGVQLYQLRDEYLRVVHFDRIFNIRGDDTRTTEGLLVVVESRGKRIALRVDDLLAQQQVVIKSLEENFCKVDGIAGATILGDGTVAMILDIGGVMHLSQPDLSPIPPPGFFSPPAQQSEEVYEHVNGTCNS
jgi:two-component system chemotaxis sensor kinase CheA